MAYDGRIKIDTKIDSKGFNGGIKAMTASVAKLGLAIGVAFGIGAVVNFGKSAVGEASKMASAFIGLRSIVEGTGNSFNGALEFINGFVSDGLVPAQNAITAYKNLLLRGYDTTQIEQTLAALKDSAAFGRSGALTLGEAVQSATEGLKNENSILVDNAGVTKNVSVLWKEYAASIGTTVGALTKQQKIQAEVEGIMRETRFQTSDAAKLAATYAGQVSALGVSFLNLKIAVGNAIIPIIQKILPYIRAAVDALTYLFNRIALIIGILFGTSITAQAGQTADAMGGAADATNAAADAQGNLADKTTKAGKAAKGALASFDQLNVLQQDTPNAAAAGSGAGVGDLAGLGGGVLGELDTTALDDGLDEMRAKVLAWKEDFLTFIQPISEAFGRLVEAVKPLGETLFSGLQWIWENVLKPLGIWAAQSLVPAIFDLLAAAAAALNEVLIALQPLGIWLWETFLKPLGEWTGQAIIDAITWITERLEAFSDWIKDNQSTVETLATLFLSFLAALYLVNAAFAIYTGVIALAGALTTTFGAILAIVTSPIFLVIVAIAALIAIIIYWDEVWAFVSGAIVAYATWAFGNLMSIINAFGEYFEWAWGNLTGVYEAVADGIVSYFEWAFGNLQTIVRGIVNVIIDIVNGMINNIVGGINTMLGLVNTVGGALPGFSPVGLVTAPQIPRLATGAVIPPNAEFAAILGDQRSGRNIEAPEGLIRKIMQEELGNAKTEIRVEFTGSLAELARQLKPKIDAETTRKGGSLVTGGAIA